MTNERVYPMSALQQHLWFEHQLNPDRAQYNMGFGVRIIGALHRENLERAWGMVVSRHETLRTYIRRMADGDVCQLVVAHVDQALSLIADAPDIAAASTHARQFVRQPYRLEIELPWRAGVIRLAPQDHLLVLGFHHIICDHQSIGVVARELSACYNALAAGRAPDLAPPSMQYGEWAVRSRTPQVASSDLDYWTGRLRHLPPRILLPKATRASAAAPDRVSGRRLPVALLAGINGLQREMRATKAMILLAAFQAFLARITGQDDLVVAMPSSVRDPLEAADVVGFFVNLLPIRAELTPEMTFRDLIRHTRQRVIEALAHGALPLSQMVSHVGSERGDGANPLVQVVFSALPGGGTAPGFVLEGLSCEPVTLDVESWRMDLVLFCRDTPQGLDTTLEFNPGLFVGAVMSEWLESFGTFLQAAVADPLQPLRDLPLVLAAARARVLSQGVGPCVTPVEWKSIPAQVAAAIERDPDAVAVEDTAGRRLSYRALDRAAGRVAKRLRAAEVGAEDCVALLMPRSVNMVVALLAVWKTGAAYLPLDPDLPEARQRAVVGHARPKAILVVRESLPLDLASPTMITVSESDWSDAIDASPDESWAPVAPEQLAYIIYTSGSTGQPKGVAVSHRGLANYVNWAISEYPVSAGVTAPVHSPLSFDLTVTTLLCPLVTGTIVSLLPEHRGRAKGALEVDALAAYFATHTDVGVAKMTPSHLQMLSLSARMSASVPLPRCVIVGGEALTYEMLASWRHVLPTTRIVNEYGPTEAVVGCCTYDARAVDAFEGPVPIGRPIVNARLYVLDAGLQPVPTGVRGELFIGGRVLARGYWRQPGTTADRFLPDPFSDEPGGRMYRTGDLVKCNHDGDLEFIGRNDDQVKVRGHRVELQEIEVALRSLASVRDGRVMVDDLDSGALVACVVPVPGAVLSKELVHARLAGQLPEYMIPGRIAIVDALPLTPNGKVDTRALKRQMAADGDVATPPESETELRLAAIWKTFLQDVPSMTANFFELGGHSLSCQRLIGQVQKEFGVAVSLSQFLMNPTIRHQAGVIDAKGTRTAPGTIPLQPRGHREPLFLIPAIGHVHAYYPLAAHLGTDHPCHAVTAPHPTEIVDYLSVTEIAKRCIERLESIAPSGPVMLGGYSFGSMVAFEMAQQFRQRGRPVGFLGLIDGGAPHYINRAGRTDLETFAGVARDLARQRNVDLGLTHEQVASLEQTNGAAVILQRLKDANVIEAAGADEAWLQKFLRGLSHLMRAIREYEPAPYPGPVTFFRSQKLEPESARSWAAAGVDVTSPDKGWQELCEQALDIRFVPAYHSTLLKEPAVQLLARELRDALAQSPALGAIDSGHEVTVA